MHERVLGGLVRAWKERAPGSHRAIRRFVSRHHDELLADVQVLLSERPAPGPWFKRGDPVAMQPEHGLVERGEVWLTEIREGRQFIKLRRGKWWPSSSFALEPPPPATTPTAAFAATSAGPITREQLDEGPAHPCC